VQVCEESRHLFIVEAAGKGRHHSLPGQNNALHFSVAGRHAAGQSGLVEKAMQIGRRLLQLKVVVLMAMGAPPVIEMLPGQFLFS